VLPGIYMTRNIPTTKKKKYSLTVEKALINYRIKQKKRDRETT
jgi:hypothetical protein